MHKQEAKFFSLINKTNSCWLWQGNIQNAGYGRMYFHGTRQLAHRISYQIHHGDIPEGLFICHHCDNPPCVNPEHLFLGDAKANSADMSHKGRAAHTIKFPPAQTTHIKQLRDEGVPEYKVAEAFGVDSCVIRRIAGKRPNAWIKTFTHVEIANIVLRHTKEPVTHTAKAYDVDASVIQRVLRSENAWAPYQGNPKHRKV